IDGDDADRAFEDVAVLDRTPYRGVAAVARSIEAHARAVGDSLRDGPFDAVFEIVLHFVAPFAVARKKMLPSKSFRSAKLRLQHRITSGRERLDFRAVTPRRPLDVPTAVNDHHHR